MSTCVSSHGEFSTHTPLDTDPLVCAFCHRFDEDEARDRLRELEERHGAVTDRAKEVSLWLEAVWQANSGWRDAADMTWAGGFRMLRVDGSRFVVNVEQVDP